jgi:hypothetical protein
MSESRSVAHFKCALLSAAMAIAFTGLATAQSATAIGDLTDLKGKVSQYALSPRGALN